ncbi:MAG: beta galactosidase jelly roll domain-containing protein [Prolixibacteraceae bacterium]|nr:beta galactosidase jelly roll domain-containing protein [Prolixibacteraceae bacterium]
MRKLIFALLFMLLSGSAAVRAADWSYVVDLEGYWYFSVGDNPEWAAPETDVSDWDKIRVPGKWEEYYPGYNGYAWYRKDFDMRSYPDDGELFLFLGEIDDVDEVFVNGVKIGNTGGFFPDYFTAYNVYRRYAVPSGILKPAENVIAVRVYDEGLDGGIVRGDKIGIFYDNDVSLISQNLSGIWKFSTFRERDMHEPGFDDSNWDEIYVPGGWNSQGYAKHDGYAWYRKEFTLPDELSGEDLFLSLGRIDDFDRVYLNGKYIARTSDLEVYNRLRKWQAYRMFRVYEIPRGVLKKNNVLVVEVYDEQQEGGIYEGPVGLVTRRNANILIEHHDDVLWGSKVESIIRSIFDW